MPPPPSRSKNFRGCCVDCKPSVARRRPFYYFGALQGALGGLLAALLVAGALAMLAAPVGELAALYGGNFSLRAPGVVEVAGLAALGAFLGWLGAQLSVSLSLRKFD